MKVLVIHASAGAGHMKAAEALAHGLEKDESLDVRLVDALDYTSPTFKNLYRNTYKTLITYFSPVWGCVFALLNVAFLQWPVRRFRRVYNMINASRLHKYLKEERFDYIFSTHFMPTEVTAALIRKGDIASKLITIVTDYDVHRIWLADGVYHYGVACDFTKQRMLSYDIPDRKVTVTGIPTHENFSKGHDRGQLKDKLGIQKDIFTVLVATGSFGIGPIEEIIQKLPDIQVVVVCGHNKSLYEKLNQNKSDNVRIFGLVDNMHELMAVSDVMVTKPGGLSISEALVSQVPLVFFNAIPGQEANNVRVLNQYGVGSKECSVDEIAQKLRTYKESKDIFLTDLKKTAALARPHAVKDLIRLIQ